MDKNISRKQRARRVRAKIKGTAKCPRLSIYRSLRYIYAQVIDDESGKVLVAVDSRKLKKTSNDMEAAKDVGAKIAELAIAKKVSDVIFDRQGYKYHGRVKSLADAAREAGLKF